MTYSQKKSRGLIMSNKAPANWKEKTLGEVCIVQRGSSPRPIKNFLTVEDDGVNWIRIGDCFGKYVTSTSQKITKEGAKKSRQVQKGDFIISNSMSYGKPYILKIDGYIHDGWFVLKLDKNLINTDFFYYLLSSNYIKEQYDKLATGAIVQNISSDLIKKVQFLLPPLSEQERIVRILDEVFENIEKAKQNTLKNLNNAKELFEAFLMQIFSNSNHWERKKLEDVAIDFGRGRSRHRPRNDKKLYGGKYPFIQTGDVRNSNHFITEYSQTYNDEGLAQSKLWPKGTLCITIAANIAETGILTFDACFPDSVIGCVFDNNETNIYYVEYLLQSFKSILQAEGKGSAQDNINLGTFEKYSFPFPEKETQDSIVKKLDNMREFISNLEQTYNQKLKSLEELKQSILQKAFNGEL